MTEARPYAELQVTTNFSFLEGGSHPEELVRTAAAHGLAAIGITDRNTLAGVVRGWIEAKRLKLAYRTGCRLVFADGAPDMLCYPTDREAYARLCRLLSLGKQRTAKGDCRLLWPDLEAHADGQLLIVLPPPLPDPAFAARLQALAHDRRGRVWLAASRRYAANDALELHRLQALADRAGAPLVATNDVLYHHPARRPLQDVLTCIRDKVTIDRAGFRLQAHAERHLKPPSEMARLFARHPDALDQTIAIAERIGFDLGQLAYDYPHEPVPPGESAIGWLARLTWEGAAWRYPDGIPAEVRATLVKELAYIAEQDLPHYFLTVHDLVRFARAQGILCQGRGSAANSAVCFCLGITAVDPDQHDVLFERFLSKNRDEPPDIDVDFEHERREEVMQYVYRRYGRARAAIVATVIHYRPRSAIREVGKALGLGEEVTARIAGLVWGEGGGLPEPHLRQAGLDPEEPLLARAAGLARELIGFPRHLSQHVGGFVLTERRLDDTVPIGPAAMKDRTFIEWDKDDIDALKIMKVDVLALGMLSCLRRGFELLRRHKGSTVIDIAELPAEDPAVYAMLSKADSIGVFQVESRAQMSMLPRLRPRCFYDLVIEVAIVRPGPIQGDMVHPYLRRRDGLDPVAFPAPAPPHDPNELRSVLGRTLGVPLFQEQAMRLAIVAAGFSGEEANGLRRAMATFRHDGHLERYEERFVRGMTARGYEPDFARRCFAQIKGFGSYGFPESHAASFANLVYASAWIKCHHPDVFCAAILNSQPLGFYQPAQLVRDAREHGVEVRPVDVLHSLWDCTLEPPAEQGPLLAVRLGFRMVGGLRAGEMARLIRLRAAGAGTAAAFAQGGIERQSLERLAEADAFRSAGLDRRRALWAVRGLETHRPATAPLLALMGERADEPVTLPVLPLPGQVAEDYRATGLSLKAHPCRFFRSALTARGVTPALELQEPAWRNGRPVAVAGLVLIRQRPGTAKGVVFATLEDETGQVNIVIWRDRLEADRAVVMTSAFLLVRGRVQKAGSVIHVVAERFEDLTPWLRRLNDGGPEGAIQKSRDFR